MADLKWTPPPTASAGDVLRAAARVLDVAEKERLERLTRSEVLDGGMPTPEAFRKALRMAQRVYMDRHPPRYVNSDQADASDSDAATELRDCYRAALAALGVKGPDDAQQ